MSNLTPAQIVSQLDQHIIGQSEAKRAVAIALRNRWRRIRYRYARGNSPQKYYDDWTNRRR